MTWMQYGDTTYEIGSTDPGGITPKMIAHSLARINRFNGHTERGVLSVASHSVYVSGLLDYDPLAALYGLVHDVAETVTGDIPLPIKLTLQAGARADLAWITSTANKALYSALCVPYPVPKDIETMVKWADRAACAAERRDLMPKCQREWEDKIRPCHLGVQPQYTAANDAMRWLARYTELTLALNDEGVLTPTPR